MVTKDLQTLNLKFDQVMFNSLVLTWERNFEVTFGIFSVLELVTIKLFFLTFSGFKMCAKIAISAYIVKIVENDPFLRLQMKAKEMFNHH